MSNHLMINDIKTEFLIIGSRLQLAKILSSLVNLTLIPQKAFEILDRGLMLKYMRMNVHICKTFSKAFHGLCKIREIRKFLHINTTQTLVHALVSSHLDYCNALLFGSPKYQLERARVIFQLSKFDHITPPALVDLHWLPIDGSEST